MKNCESLKPARNNTFEGGNKSFEIPKNTLAKTVILNSKTLPSYTKIDTILYLPYLKPLRHKLQKLHLVDRGYEEKFAAFTLAETLITLTILGVVAAITVPMLINKQMEAANRTKLKKAMATYEKALNQMIIDNDIKGTITAVEGFGIGECDISSEYFKAVEILNGNNCRFKTADKVGYDITDITHPIFFLSEDTDNNDVFGGVGEIKDGIVRINDKGAATGDNATILNKTYAFMNNEAVGNSTIDPSRPCSDSTKNGEGKYFSCTEDTDIPTDIPGFGYMHYSRITYDNQGRIDTAYDEDSDNYIKWYYNDDGTSHLDVFQIESGNDECICNYAYDINADFTEGVSVSCRSCNNDNTHYY